MRRLFADAPTPATPPWLRALTPDLQRGLRAALVMVVPFTLAGELDVPELRVLALGGWLGALADPGGDRELRRRTLMAFAVLGGTLTAVGGLVDEWPWLAAIALGVVATAAALLRALGAAGATVGTLVTVVFAIAVGAHGTSAVHALWFSAGVSAAALLSSIAWPVRTHLPVRRAIAHALGELAAYARAVVADARGPESEDPARWALTARTHRRRIRDAIEDARVVAYAIRARRSGDSALGTGLRVLLGLVEAQTAAVVTLAVEAEQARPAERAGDLAALARAADLDEAIALAVISPRDVGYVRASHDDAMIARLERVLEQTVEVAFTLDAPRDDPAPAPGIGGSRTARDVLRTLRVAASPRSEIAQHALRVGLVAFVATWVGRIASPEHAHWVTVTAVTVMQPYPGVTYRRAIERVVGTVFGSLLAVGIVLVVHAPWALAAIMVPLSIAAVATKPRSYRLFTFFVTPTFVMLAERFPGDWHVAAARAGDAMLGGGIALVFSLLFLPSWERQRLPSAVGATYDALAAYAAAVIARCGDPTSETIRAELARARREAGVALSNADASLERLLAEPGRSAHGTDALALLTYGRRIAGTLTAAAGRARVEEHPPGAASLAPVARWLDESLHVAADAARAGSPVPALPAPPELDASVGGPLRARLEGLMQAVALIGAPTVGSRRARF